MSRSKIFSNILLTKVGPYCNYSLDEIIRIKTNEEKLCGNFFWGYSGVFCHPSTLAPFFKLHPKLLFTTTNSVYTTPNISRFSQYSVDKTLWYPLPKRILLVGNQQRPHFAFIAKNLRQTDIQINLNDYQTPTGKPLSQYFRYRVDKTYATYKPTHSPLPNSVPIHYTADLLDSVYIR